MKKIIERNKLRYKRDQDHKIRIQSLYNNVNDQVLVHNDHRQHKLSTEFLGSYTVIEDRRPNYLLRIGKTKTSLVHGNRLRPYRSIPGCSPRTDNPDPAK